MMTIRRIVDYITAEPFRPFRINMASGKGWEIRHPEMVKVGKSIVTIFTFSDGNAEETKEHWHDVSLILIESVEPIDSSVHQAQ